MKEFIDWVLWIEILFVFLFRLSTRVYTHEMTPCYIRSAIYGQIIFIYSYELNHQFSDIGQLYDGQG